MHQEGDATTALMTIRAAHQKDDQTDNSKLLCCTTRALWHEDAALTFEGWPVKHIRRTL